MTFKKDFSLPNVCLVCPSNSQGLKDYSFSLASAIESCKKTNLTLVTNKEFNKPNDKINLKRVFYTDKLKYPYNVFILFKTIKSLNPDVVHSQSTNLVILLLLFVFRMVLGYKLILTPHSVISHWDRPLYEILQPYIYKNVDGIIWHTEQDKKIMQNKLGVTAKNCAVIPHGNYNFYSSLSNFSALEAKKKLNINEEKFTLLFFGYIRKDKRLDLILKALGELDCQEKAKIQLVIAGSVAHDYKPYKELIENLKLKEQVIEHLCFIDEEEVSVYFKAADVLVAPYDTISESGVVHIAFSFGKPVIASDVGGFKERIKHGENGLKFQVGDYEDLQEQISYAIRNKREMKKIGEYNKYLANNVYDWESIAEKTIDFYREVLK